MPKWTDFGNVWTTLREIDVSAIRTEAEKPIAIACVGQQTAIDAISSLLHTGPDRYGPVGIDPLETVPLEQLVSRSAALRTANLVIVALDARAEVATDAASALAQVSPSSATLVVLINGASVPSGLTLPRGMYNATLVIPDPTAIGAGEKLADEVLETLPSELQLSAARRLPGLRAAYARSLLTTTSMSNATYALGTSLPEQIPVLNVPFAIADIVVLTKNQALMVYRMALAYGAHPEFQERLREVLPVIGGGLVWRQLARTLVSLIPVWGVVPKVAIAYGGTYATGAAAWGWFANGERLSTEELKRLTNEAMAMGRARAKEIADRANQMRPTKTTPAALPSPEFNGLSNTSSAKKENWLAWLRQRLPGGQPATKPPVSDEADNT